MLDYFFPYLAALIIGLVAPHFLIARVVRLLWKVIGQSYKRSDLILSSIQGLVERALYVFSFMIGKPEFIGAWLVLKVASQWKEWQQKPGYNIFLIGSGFSILYAAAGAYSIRWIQSFDWMNLLIFPGALVLSTIGLILFLNRMKKPRKKG